MRAVRFVLAVPHRQSPHVPCHIEDAQRPGDVCGRSPRLWAGEGVPQIDFGSAGRAVGVAFARDTARRCFAAPAGAPANGRANAFARWILRTHWGAYFAILTCKASRGIHVLVDPSGLLPVYRTDTRSHALLASHPELLAKALGRPLEICWTALRAHLERPELRRRATCLLGVSEVPPGMLVPLGLPERPSQPIWRPEDFLPQGAASFDDAADELGGLAAGVIGAWAGCLGPVSVAASGGVDSSFICAALARGGHDFACVTLRTADPSGDESAFVRTLANHLGAAFHSKVYDPKQIDPRRSASAGLPRPSRRFLLSAVDAGLLDAAASAGSSTVFDGNGGDNLFCFLHSAAPVVDHLFSQGPRKAVRGTLLDMCRVTDCDLATMVRAVVRRLVRPTRGFHWPVDPRLLTLAPAQCDHIEPLSPWLDVDVGRHYGKRDHFGLIMRAQNHVHGLGAGGLPRFSPLMSQPLLEFCLGVPTWLWCRGGLNRALARAAFGTDLPPNIVQRTSKAGPDSMIRQAFEINRPLIRELLMGGLLAEHGLLDLDAIEKALQVDAFCGDSIVYRLLDLAEAEAWARWWTG